MRKARRGKRTTEEIEFAFAVSNQQFASQIGTVRELVSRDLGRLQAAGFINLDGRTVVIPDLDTLGAEINE